MEEKLNGKTIMVTGGTGFIGSHTVVDLLEKGYRAVIVDDLSNSSKVVLDRIASIVGDEAAANMSFHEADVSDAETLDAIFREEGPIDAVIHFAGYKAVGESVQKPIEYYSNNLGTTLTLIDTMRRNGCKSIVFSSSATVYGDPDSLPLDESAPKKPATNPYGWTKWMIEQILTDTAAADPEWNVVLLRYFNPVGAHPSGLMGEDPKGIPNNLMPFVSQVAVGRRDAVHVFGDDYPTPDGTGVRDYIHVCDLATGWTGSTGPRSSTSARARGRASSRSSRRSPVRAGATCHMSSTRDDPATLPRTTRAARRRAGSWAGRRRGTSTICAAIAGIGNRRIPTDTRDRQAISESRYDMEKMCSGKFRKKVLALD